MPDADNHLNDLHRLMPGKVAESSAEKRLNVNPLKKFILDMNTNPEVPYMCFEFANLKTILV